MRKSVIALVMVGMVFGSAVSLQAQDWAKAALDKSPRHREYVPVESGGRTLQTFVVYPEVKSKAPVVVLIHEIFGLSDWAKEMADDIAAQGYIVVAPDLLSGMGPGGGGTDSFPAQDAVTKAVSGLNGDQVLKDLDAVADYGKSLPSANGVVYVAGFCWGGGKSFAFATHRHDLSAAFVFYGPPPADVSTITAPVYGFYAGNDARITATVPTTTEAMKAAGKKYETAIYDGAGHGFMRAGEAPDANDANKAARTQAFAKMLAVMKADASAPHTARPGAGKGHVPSPRLKPTAAEPSCHDMKASPSGAMEMAAIM